jgi:hypothetical protein
MGAEDPLDRLVATPERRRVSSVSVSGIQQLHGSAPTGGQPGTCGHRGRLADREVSLRQASRSERGPVGGRTTLGGHQGRLEMAAAGGADRRSAKNADRPINQSREAHRSAWPLHSPEAAKCYSRESRTTRG